MITYKVGICDDEADEVKKIEDLLHEYEATHNIHFEIHSYTDGLKLLRDYQKPHMLHALFLDVEMPLFNGIDLAEHLRGLPDRDLHIIFLMRRKNTSSTRMISIILNVWMPDDI